MEGMDVQSLKSLVFTQQMEDLLRASRSIVIRMQKNTTCIRNRHLRNKITASTTGITRNTQ